MPNYSVGTNFLINKVKNRDKLLFTSYFRKYIWWLTWPGFSSMDQYCTRTSFGFTCLWLVMILSIHQLVGLNDQSVRWEYGSASHLTTTLPYFQPTFFQRIQPFCGFLFEVEHLSLHPFALYRCDQTFTCPVLNPSHKGHPVDVASISRHHNSCDSFSVALTIYI
jgi:hypothetical protein